MLIVLKVLLQVLERTHRLLKEATVHLTLLLIHMGEQTLKLLNLVMPKEFHHLHLLRM